MEQYVVSILDKRGRSRDCARVQEREQDDNNGDNLDLQDVNSMTIPDSYPTPGQRGQFLVWNNHRPHKMSLETGLKRCKILIKQYNILFCISFENRG